MRVSKGSGNLQNGKRNRQKSQIKKLQHKPLTKYRNRQVNPPIWGLPCLFFTCLPFSFAILAVWIQGALSRRLGNMYFHISRNKQIIRTRPPQGRTGSDYIGLVRQAGIDRLTALRLQAASSPHTVRHRITRCQRLHRSFLPRSCPLGSDSRILYAHIKTGMQKKHPCFDGAGISLKVIFFVPSL